MDGSTANVATENTKAEGREGKARQGKGVSRRGEVRQQHFSRPVVESKPLNCCLGFYSLFKG